MASSTVVPPVFDPKGNVSCVRFEPSASKVVRVIPEVEGSPARGFSIGTVTAEPDTVEVVGPASIVKGMSEAMTEPVSVEGARATVSEMVTVGVADPAVSAAPGRVCPRRVRKRCRRRC